MFFSFMTIHYYEFSEILYFCEIKCAPTFNFYIHTLEDITRLLSVCIPHLPRHQTLDIPGSDCNMTGSDKYARI